MPYKRVDTGRARVFEKRPQAEDRRRRAGVFAAARNRRATNIEFCGRVSDEELRGLYARCRAFVMPGEEDFGITAVEAIASGKAVIALGRGGVLEIVPEEGAFFYDSPDEGSLEAAIRRFEAAEATIRRGAITDRRRSDSPRPNSIAKCGRYCISMSSRRVIRAPRGRELRCKGWRQEGALRMLMNNLDPEVAERPDDLIVYGGTGRAARSWEAFDAIVRSLESLEE